MSTIGINEGFRYSEGFVRIGPDEHPPKRELGNLERRRVIRW